MANEWLLIETFGGRRREPTLLAVGSSPRTMVPLRTILGRGPYLNDVLALVAHVVASGESIRTTTTDRRRQMIGDPLRTFGGRVQGVWVWVDKLDQTPPPRDLAGAFHQNLTTLISSRSDDLLDVYGVAPENRVHVHSLAEQFGRLGTNTDEARALAMLVKSEPGVEHQATWTVTRDDGTRRAVNFACRCVEETGPSGRREVVVRGITHDIGPAEAIPAAPPVVPVLLAQQVVAAEQTPGRWRAIVDLRTMRLLKWLDDAVPGIAWRMDSPFPPGLHRRDLASAVRMRDALDSSGRVESELRFRAMDGGWMRLVATANLMLLDQYTTAALVTLSLPDGR